MLLVLLSAAAALRAPGPLIDRRSAAALICSTPAWLAAWPVAAATDEEKYFANPADLSGLKLPDGCAGAKDVFLIFHGAGGPDRETDDLEARVRAQDAAAGFKRTVRRAPHDGPRSTDYPKLDVRRPLAGCARGLAPVVHAGLESHLVPGAGRRAQAGPRARRDRAVAPIAPRGGHLGRRMAGERVHHCVRRRGARYTRLDDPLPHRPIHRSRRPGTEPQRRLGLPVAHHPLALPSAAAARVPREQLRAASTSPRVLPRAATTARLPTSPSTTSTPTTLYRPPRRRCQTATAMTSPKPPSAPSSRCQAAGRRAARSRTWGCVFLATTIGRWATWRATTRRGSTAPEKSLCQVTPTCRAAPSRASRELASTLREQRCHSLLYLLSLTTDPVAYTVGLLEPGSSL